MNRDLRLFRWLGIFLLVPIALAFFGGDRFRYPCQNPENWEKEICKLPLCDVTRTCPQHIFKGQRDPRLGPPDESKNVIGATAPAPAICPTPTKGEACAK
jgi:hypothetical protein